MLIGKSNDCIKCGSGHMNQCFAIYDNGWHCFSCGASYIQDGDNYSFMPRKVQASNIYIPPDASTDFNKAPIEITEWLYRSHLYKDEIKKYNVMHVPYDKFLTTSGLDYTGASLLFPIIKNNEIVYYQRRFFPDKQILTVGNNSVETILNPESSETVVLVEDYVSAMRVAKQYAACCLFGTKLKSSNLSYILSHYDRIYIWLDGDKPGQENSKRIFNKIKQELEKIAQSSAFKQRSVKVSEIFTEKDPKFYTDTEISQFIEQ